MDYTLRSDKHQTLTIHVTATASVEIIYQTEDHTVIKRDTVNGLVGHSTHLTFNVPTGYEVVGNLPASTYTFAAKTNDPIVITVRANTTPVTPTNPDNPPVNPNKPDKPDTPDNKPDKPNKPDTPQNNVPGQPNKPTKPGQSTALTPVANNTNNAARPVQTSSKTAAAKQVALPQTGTNKAGVIGLALAAILAAFGLAPRKKHEN